jgi:G3E family GTPase
LTNLTLLEEDLYLTNEKSTQDDNDDDRFPIPVILLAGFLGTGKTTTLKHILENKDNRKVGVIVNDVASVNIDAKLIARNPYDSMKSNNYRNDFDPKNADFTMIDLQNGCVCCSLADEFFFSIENLITTRKHIDTVIVELSGVSDPMAMKSNWIMAPPFITSKCKLAGIVTVVDAASFGIDYMSWDDTLDRPNWTPNSRRKSSDDDDDDDDDNDMSNGLSSDYDSGTHSRKVAELLAEQVEAADIIVLNKCDIADNDQIRVTKSVVRGLNKDAQIETANFGQISSNVILDRMKKRKELSLVSSEEKHNSQIPHDGDDLCESKEGVASIASAVTLMACTEPLCTDATHSHDHSLTDVEKGDPCSDSTCTDPTHIHDHSHSHNSINHDVGIVSFTYKASRPFNAGKIMEVLNSWPVPLKDTLDIELLLDATKSGYEIQGKKMTSQRSPFVGVIRSKGFCWFAPYNWDTESDDAQNNEDVVETLNYNQPIDDTWRHDTAMYWSHAGRQFSISSAGQWWGTISADTMKIYFSNNMDEYNRIRREDFVTTDFGDRRQEIVFIGTGLNEDNIRSTLDACLLSDIEMDHYRSHVQKKRSRQQNSVARI